MSKILRHSQSKEIETYLSTSDKIASELKIKILEELHDKGKKYKDSFIWLIERNKGLVIDVFDVRGDVFETDTYYFKDFPINL